MSDYPSAPNTPVTWIPPMGVGDALSWAWSSIKRQPILIAGIGIWTALEGSGGASYTRHNADGSTTSYGGGFGIVSTIATILAPIVFAHIGLAIASGKRVTFGEFFRFRCPNFWSLVGAGILIGIGTIAGLIVLIIPGVILWYLWYFTQLVGVERGTGAIDSMRESRRILGANTSTLIPFALTGFGLYLLGALTIVGWIITAPLVVLMTAYAYVRVQGYDVAR